jgi:hypothetical protein
MSSASSSFGSTFDAATISNTVQTRIADAQEQARSAALYSAEMARQLGVIAMNGWLAFLSVVGTDVLLILLTIGIFALVVYVYLKLKPTILLEPGHLHGQCPDRWIFRPDDNAGKCWPLYETSCAAFDPALYKGTLCDIAKSCGTTWKGLCN